MIYTKYTGTGTHVELPASPDPYTVIGPKAFLSCKEIQQLTLPPSVLHIDDWAFAHMHNLTRLLLPANPIHFGKQVFLDCPGLEQIQILPDTSDNPGLPFFLASAVTILQDMSLLTPEQAAGADTHSDWMGTYDQVLERFLSSPDEAGFEPVFYGWFNDEDAESTQLPRYIRSRREQKTSLAFTRLQYDLYLSDRLRELLQAYLRDHMLWGAKAREHHTVWDLLPTRYPDQVRCYELLEQAGALDPEQISLLIAHLKDASAEVLAYLLRYQEKNRKFSDFFENFSL